MHQDDFVKQVQAFIADWKNNQANDCAMFPSVLPLADWIKQLESFYVTKGKFLKAAINVRTRSDDFFESFKAAKPEHYEGALPLAEWNRLGYSVIPGSKSIGTDENNNWLFGKHQVKLREVDPTTKYDTDEDYRF